ncbi:actin interacting protein 3-domain-containing protein [Syncephalis fuscata]|nr:actin interacting protein 3-domain-containing protein [Syncephalis fuscata]
MASYPQRSMGASDGRQPSRQPTLSTSSSAGQGRPLPSHQGQQGAVKNEQGYTPQQEQRYKELLRQEQQLQQLQQSKSLSALNGGASTADNTAASGQGIRRSTKSIRRLSAYRPGASHPPMDDELMSGVSNSSTSSNLLGVGAATKKDLPSIPVSSGRPLPNVSSSQDGQLARKGSFENTASLEQGSNSSHSTPRSAPGSRKNTLNDGSSAPNAPRSLFLQVGRETKRVAFPTEALSLELIRKMFKDRFARLTAMSGPLTIQIRDPSIGVFYLLETMSDIRDKTVLRVRVPDDDPLELLRNRVDLGFTGVAASITDLRTSIAKQHNLSKELKTSQDSLVLSQQQQQEKLEQSLTQLEQLQQQVDTIKLDEKTAPASADNIPKGVNTSAEIKGLQRDLRSLQDELGSVRRAYDLFRKDTVDVVETLEKQCAELRTALDNERLRTSGSARAFITEGQTIMDARTETVASKIEDAEDICNAIKLDLTQRRSMPSEAHMKAVREALSMADKELTSLNDMLEETRPKWKTAWEKELQAVLNEQQFLKEQEELLLDLHDDSTRLTELFDQLQQVAKLQSRQGLRKQPNLQVLSAEEGFLQLNQVMQEITCIEPDSNRRLQALEQAERLRKLELDQKVDEFEEELGNFVAEKKLRPTGGVEEAERRREERQKEAIRAMLASMADR